MDYAGWKKANSRNNIHQSTPTKESLTRIWRRNHHLSLINGLYNLISNLILNVSVQRSLDAKKKRHLTWKEKFEWAKLPCAKTLCIIGVSLSKPLNDDDDVRERVETKRDLLLFPQRYQRTRNERQTEIFYLSSSLPSLTCIVPSSLMTVSSLSFPFFSIKTCPLCYSV